MVNRAGCIRTIRLCCRTTSRPQGFRFARDSSEGETGPSGFALAGIHGDGTRVPASLEQRTWSGLPAGS